MPGARYKLGASIQGFTVIWEVDLFVSLFSVIVTEPLWQEFHALAC